MTHGSSSTGVPQHPVQTWIKNFAVIANPNPTDGTNQLRSHKNGFSPGAGEWDLYWWSDVVSKRFRLPSFCVILELNLCSSR